MRDTGGVGFLMAGLSHEEKKSSSGSPAGVVEPSTSLPSLITTSLGYLAQCQPSLVDEFCVFTGGRTPWHPSRPVSSVPPYIW